MPDESYQRMLTGYLQGELRVINAHLPVNQKSLYDLLNEEYPAIVCKNGENYLFKRRELQLLAGMLTEEEQHSLMLPMLIEVQNGEEETYLICRGNLETKVISWLLKMELRVKSDRITLYRPQLALIRKDLRTATQYVFSQKSSSEIF